MHTRNISQKDYQECVKPLYHTHTVGEKKNLKKHIYTYSEK